MCRFISLLSFFIKVFFLLRGNILLNIAYAFIQSKGAYRKGLPFLNLLFSGNLALSTIFFSRLLNLLSARPTGSAGWRVGAEISLGATSWALFPTVLSLLLLVFESSGATPTRALRGISGWWIACAHTLGRFSAVALLSFDHSDMPRHHQFGSFITFSGWDRWNPLYQQGLRASRHPPTQQT